MKKYFMYKIYNKAIKYDKKANECYNLLQANIVTNTNSYNSLF
jgi:hypothetical protein